MADLQFNDVGIKAISATVPNKVFSNFDLDDLGYSKEEINKIVENVGIVEKRIADPNVCASDLCIIAANEIFRKTEYSKSDVDVCIFLSQSPDYKIPATSPIIQHSLGLSNETICFDVNLACSGFVYGLSIAYMYAAMPQIKNVLLLVGETFSKFINQRDRVNFPLYGDAGTAVLVGKGEFGKSWFNLNSDGDGFEMVNIRGGHCRNPFNSDSLNLIDQGKFGALRDIDLYMDGLRVFNFAIKKVPSSINRVLKDAAIDIDLVDDVVFHQANRFMTDFLAKKLRIPNEKNHYSLRKFGNTSSASIPLTIVVCKDEFSKLREAVLLSGFGAGMSWATALVNLKKSIIIELIES